MICTRDSPCNWVQLWSLTLQERMWGKRHLTDEQRLMRRKRSNVRSHGELLMFTLFSRNQVLEFLNQNYLNLAIGSYLYDIYSVRVSLCWQMPFLDVLPVNNGVLGISSTTLLVSSPKSAENPVRRLSKDVKSLSCIASMLGDLTVSLVFLWFWELR
jgi:hypothetical protein